MTIDICLGIDRLLKYAQDKELIEKEDIIYMRNKILDILQIDEYVESKKIVDIQRIDFILNNILDWAYENKRLEYNTTVYRDLLDTKIMAALIKRPSEIIKEFNRRYEINPKEATNYFYDLSKNSNYIREDRINKNLFWSYETKYGPLEITINLSKPEKDPNAIKAARYLKSSSYPKCLLCKENEGYRGRINHPARQNHRVIPMKLNGESWYLQYSPYVYYNEHSIIFKEKHEPMKININTFKRILDFVDILPHYFIGSNADLPIVGGSILSHDHFQGGCYEFPMAKGKKRFDVVFKGYEHVNAQVLDWYMSVIRLRSKDKEKLVLLADKILKGWRTYSDVTLNIYATTGNESHNTITPIGRKKEGYFEMDIVLRNNKTTEEHPLGIYHPHEEVHHIKKENIGLIEVMGLAVLPARLKEELNILKNILLKKDNIKNHEHMHIHKDWYEHIKKSYENITHSNVDKIIEQEVALKFATVLTHAGVFKNDDEGNEGIKKFISYINKIGG